MHSCHCDILSNSRPVVRVPYDNILSCFRTEFRMIKPVIISQRQWKAASDWSEPFYLTELLHDPHIEVLISNDNRNFLKHEYCSEQEMGLSVALMSIFSTNEENDSNIKKMYCRLYLDKYPDLAQDIDTSLLSHIASIEKFNEKNCGVWISSKGCETPLHYDLCHGFLAQVVGRKRFLLASPSDTSCMYRNTSHTTKNQTTSKVDLSLWMSGSEEQLRRHPALADAQWFVAELGPGDVLYTPPGWWHHVLSEESSISVLLPFDMVSPAERLPSLLCS